MQAANRLKATWKPGPALPAQASFYDHMRKLPSRDTLLVDSKDVDANLASAAQVVRATYLHPYHMHGSVGASCAVADVKAASATVWSPTQGVYPQRDSCAMLLGLPKEKREGDLHARIRLLRHQRRRYGFVRCRADVAGRRPSRARAALAQGRDGVGELWSRLCRRSARRPRSRRQHHRVGLRSLVAYSRRTARIRPAGQSGHRFSGRPPACCLRSAVTGAAADRPAGEWPERRAFVRRRRHQRRFGRHRESSRASACSRASSSLRSGPARSARRIDCRTRSRTNASWTSSPRASRRIRSSTDCVTCAIRD